MLRRKKRKFVSHGERRKDPRREVSLSISFQVISVRDPQMRSTFKKATLKDISMGGLCFYTSEITVDGLHISYEETPREKNRLLVKLMLPPPNGPIEALAQVIWFERDFLEDKETYKVGAEFLQFSEQGKEVLRQYVKGLS